MTKGLRSPRRGSHSENERRKCRRTNGEDNGLVHLSVPPALGLRRREHATTTAYVTERGLGLSNSTEDDDIARDLLYSSPGQIGGCLHY